MKYGLSNWLTLSGFYLVTGIPPDRIQCFIKKGELVKNEDYRIRYGNTYVNKTRPVVEKIRNL